MAKILRLPLLEYTMLFAMTINVTKGPYYLLSTGHCLCMIFIATIFFCCFSFITTISDVIVRPIYSGFSANFDIINYMHYHVG